NGNEANISFTKAGGNLLTVSGTNATNMAGDLNITGGGIAFNSPASSTFGAVNITNATMSFNGASNTTMSGAVNVTNGSLTFNGATSGITATTGAMTISDNSTLSVKVNNTTSARLTTTALTLGAGGS